MLAVLCSVYEVIVRLGGDGRAYGRGSGLGRGKGGRAVKLGWEERKAATKLGLCQRSIGLSGLFGQEKGD